MSTMQLKYKANRPMLYLVLLAGLCLHGTARGAKSEEKRFEVAFDRETDSTIIYQITNEERSPLYSIPGDLGQIFLSDDGTYVAACESWLDEGYHAKSVVVRFYHFGLTQASLQLRELIKKGRGLDRNGSRFRWGQCSGFVNNEASFEIDTVEAKRIRYNVVTGEKRTSVGVWPPLSAPVVAETESSGSQSSGSQSSNNSASDNLSDLTRLYLCERMYLFCCDESTDLFCDPFVEYQAGWRQVRGKWEYDNPFLHQRSSHPREVNALMYFDNLIIADADISIWLKMDLDFPQTVIQQDENRILDMRLFAGAGLVFRLQDENNYYMFRLAGEEGAVLGKMVHGKWKNLANPRAVDFLNDNLRFSDRWYRLRVRIRGDLIQCWISEWIEEGDEMPWREQAVVSLRDDTFSTGKAGLITFKAKANFSTYRVMRID